MPLYPQEKQWCRPVTLLIAPRRVDVVCRGLGQGALISLRPSSRPGHPRLGQYLHQVKGHRSLLHQRGIDLHHLSLVPVPHERRLGTWSGPGREHPEP